MTDPRPRPIVIALALAAALLMTAAVGTSLGVVTVYDNNFSSRAEFKEMIKSGGGKRCERRYRKKAKSMLVSVKRSPTVCSFRPPVQSDGELPNHDIKLEGKLLKKTAKPLRGSAFIEIDARVGGGGIGYYLHVYPKKKRFELRRGPRAGDFPVTGKSNAIKKLNQRNKLRLVVAGARVTAYVNGEEIASVEDQNPGQVSGKKIRFAVGSEKKKAKGNVAATLKKVAVAVPDP
jgi:hypothetical protein